VIQGHAGRQHGIVKGKQARQAGLTNDAIRRRVEAGWLVRLYEGVYAVGHTALTQKSHLIAAVYACGPDALASHCSAGALWGPLRWPQKIEVTAPRGCKPKKGFTLHRSRLIHPEDRALIDNIPVTSLARTIVDLADVLSEERLADAVHEAEVRGLFDLKKVDRVLARLPGRKGRHKLRRVLAAYRDVQPFTRNRAERLVLAMCEEHGLPRPQVNTWIDEFEVDFHWPESGLVLEFDGGAVHRTTRAFHEDRRRDRALAARGIHVVRATAPDLTSGAALARQLEQILAVRHHR
jgi:very-short-patch-repair endonuclease